MTTSIPTRGMSIMTGTTHPEMARLIASHLGVTLASTTATENSAHEILVDIKETVRGKDVFVIASGTDNVNKAVMELMIMAYACRTANARTITAVLPYMPYSKQSKMRKRGCIVAKLVARMMGRAGITHVLTIDLHTKEVQAFFDMPVDNLRASPFLLQHLKENVDLLGAVVVARNATGVARATSYAERLHCPFAVIHGEEEVLCEVDQLDGRSSPPPLEVEAGASPAKELLQTRKASLLTAHKLALLSATSSTSSIGGKSASMPMSGMPLVLPKLKPPPCVVGDVSGRTALIIDDMIDDLDDYITVTRVLRFNGATRVFLVATHALFALDADLKKKLTIASGRPAHHANAETNGVDAAASSDKLIDGIIVSNTIAAAERIASELSYLVPIAVVDLSVMLAEAIRRIQNNESLGLLFQTITGDD